MMCRCSTSRKFVAVTLAAVTVGLAPLAAAGEPAPARLTLDVGHDWVPMAIAFSPEGRSLAVVGVRAVAPTQCLASLWDAGTGKREWQQALNQAADAAGMAAAFSPDGKLLAVPGGFPVSTVALLDTRSGKARTPLKVGPPAAGPGFRMAFSPDSKSLAGCVTGMPASPYALRLWNCAGGRLVSELKLPPVTPDARLDSPENLLGGLLAFGRYLAFSPEGRLVAVTTGLRVELWDVRAGRLATAVSLVPWHRQQGPMPGGLKVNVWDVRTGAQLAEMEARAQPGQHAAAPGPRKPPAGNRLGKGFPGAAAMPWQGNMPGAVLQGRYEASAGGFPPRLLFSSAAGRLAVLSGGFGNDASVDVWNLVGTTSPGNSPPAGGQDQDGSE
jgi:hypothetical protein